MNRIEEAKRMMVEALDGLAEEAMGHAIDALLSNPAPLIKQGFGEGYDMCTVLGGVDWTLQQGDQPLTIYIVDLMAEGDDQVIHKQDAIGQFMDEFRNARGEPARLEEPERDRISAAISSLESACDRLRSFQKACQVGS